MKQAKRLQCCIVAMAAASTLLFSAAVQADIIEGTNGDDVLNGTALADQIFGFAGDDTLNGGDGDDRLVGGSGADALHAGLGNDILISAAGDADVDDLWGDAGGDVFRFLAIGAAADNIRDLNLADGDAIDISHLLLGFDPRIHAVTDFVMISNVGPNSLLRVDVDGGGDNFQNLAFIVGINGLTDEQALVHSGGLIVVPGPATAALLLTGATLFTRLRRSRASLSPQAST